MRRTLPVLVQHPDGAKVKKDDRLWRIMLFNFRITGNEQSAHGKLQESLITDNLHESK